MTQVRVTLLWGPKSPKQTFPGGPERGAAAVPWLCVIPARSWHWINPSVSTSWDPELERAAGSQLVALRDTHGDRDLQGQGGTGGDALSVALHVSASKNSLEKAENKYWLKESGSGSEGLKWGCVEMSPFPSDHKRLPTFFIHKDIKLFGVEAGRTS